MLGRTFYSVGLINGGVAPNVISPSAEAELMFRTVGGPDALRALIQQRVGHRVSVEDVLVVPPVRLTTVPGFDTAVFSFTTDIPFLDRWGPPLLLGPGSVTLAHTADEYCEIAELHRAVELYARLATQLLSAGLDPLPVRLHRVRLRLFIDGLDRVEIVVPQRLNPLPVRLHRGSLRRLITRSGPS